VCHGTAHTCDPPIWWSSPPVWTRQLLYTITREKRQPLR
jgi:hypothetical protein